MGRTSDIDVRVRLRDSRRFQRDAKKSKESLEGFRGTAKGIGRDLRDTGGKLSDFGTQMSKFVTLPILGAGFASVKLAADFEQQMSNLEAVTGGGGAAIEKFRGQALKAGADTVFSAKDAAMAQVELAKAGLTTGQILGGGLDASLGLAAAGEMELAAAAGTTSTALNLFGLEGKAAMKVADELAVAANITKANVSDFAAALNQSGSVAKSVGMNFDETMLALTALGKIGIEGSDAGTSLKTALIQLVKPTEKQAKLSKKLGLDFLNANGEMKSMGQISGMLRGKLGGMTAAQRTATLATLAGTDGVRTLTSLYDAGPKRLRKWAKQLGLTGYAGDVAAKKNDNLKGKIEALKGSLETAGIILGTVLLPPLTDLAVSLTDVVNAAAPLFQSLPPGLQMAILGFAGLLAVIGPLIWIVGGFITALGAVAGAIGVASLPLIGIIVGIAALAVGLVLLWKRSTTFRKIVTGAWDAVRAAAAKAVGWLIDKAPKAWEWITDVAIPKIVELAKKVRDNTRGIQGAVKWVATAYMKYAKWMTTAMLNVVKFLRPVWVFLGRFLLDTVKTAWSGIKDVFTGAFKVITGIIGFFDALFRGDVKGMWNAVKRIFSGALQIIRGLVKWGFAVVLTTINRAGKLIGLVLRLAWNVVKAGARLAFDYIKGKVTSFIGFWKGLPGKLAGAARGAFDGLKSAFKSALNWVIEKWNGIEFKIPGFDPPGPGKFGGISIGTPDIPQLALGGMVTGLGSFITGERGPELNTITPQGVVVQPLGVAMAGAGGAAAPAAGLPDTVVFHADIHMDSRKVGESVGVAKRSRESRK